MLCSLSYNMVITFLPRLPRLVPCHRFSFASQKYCKDFDENSQDVITTMNRLNDYILGNIVTRTKEQDITEYSNRRQSVLP